jgi:hypothetical protein
MLPIAAFVYYQSPKKGAAMVETKRFVLIFAKKAKFRVV